MHSTSGFTFSIRDDDINFYSSSNELRKIYEPLFDICKPTLCITPFAGNVYKSVRDHEGCLVNTRQIKNFLKSKCSDDYRQVSAIHQNEELLL